MKRLLILFFVMTMTLTTSSYVKDISFTIISDSRKDNVVEVKNKMISTFKEIVLGINKEEYSLVINNNLELFEDKDNKVEFNDNNLSIIIGDGKGYKINGVFSNDICKVNIEKKSIIFDFLFKNK